MPKLPSSTRPILLAAAMSLTAASCTAPDRATAPEASAAAAAPRAPVNRAAEYPVIVRLAGRHQVITVTAGPGAPLYSAARHDGTPIVAAATLEQLRRDHPAVYQELVPSVATEKDRKSDSPGSAHPAAPGPDASLGAFMMMSAE